MVDISKFRFRIGDTVEYEGGYYKIIAYYFINGLNNFEEDYGYTINYPQHTGSEYSYNEEGNKVKFPRESALFIKESDVIPVISHRKPFNLEEVRDGKSVVTRNGKPVIVIYWDREGLNYPIVALVGKDKEVHEFTINGRYNSHRESNLDLFMVPEKKEGWMNVYKYNIGDANIHGGGIYSTKEESINRSCEYPDYITTIKVEWEE